MKMKKIIYLIKLKKFHKNPKIEENEKELYKAHRVTYNEFEKSLEPHPRKCSQIWQYSPNKNNEVQKLFVVG